MTKPRLNPKQKAWLKTFLFRHPYYKLERVCEDLDGRILVLSGTETLPLALIPEFAEAVPGYRTHTLRIKIRKFGDVKLTATHNVKTIYPHCHIDDKIATSVQEGQLSLSLSTVLNIPEPVNPIIITRKPKRKARVKVGIQLSLPITGLEAKLVALRQQARPHLPPVSSEELLAEKVKTWNARDRREVEVPQVILDLLLAQNATEDEWESAIDLFGVIGLASTIRFIEGLPELRQHFNKSASTAAASAAVPVAEATKATNITVKAFD